MYYNQQKLSLFREVFLRDVKKKWRKRIALLAVAWDWKGASTEIILW